MVIAMPQENGNRSGQITSLITWSIKKILLVKLITSILKAALLDHKNRYL